MTKRKSLKFSLRKHGKDHLELKTAYLLGKKAREHYSLNIYFFFPPRLNLNKEYYGVQRALRDVFTATRLSSPRLSLEELCNKENLSSPLTRLYILTEGQEKPDHNTSNRIIYELKMLINSCRRTLTSFRKQTAKSLKAGDISHQSINEFLDGCEKLIQMFRMLEVQFTSRSSTLQTAYTWIDKTLSLILTDVLLRLLITDDTELFSSSLRDRITSLVELQQKYRVQKGYTNGDTDAMHLHQALLKKWTQSALYLEVHKKKYSQNLFHILASVSAGAAMLLSIVLAFLAQRFFNLYSTPWIIAIVLSYVFKDRIKEILRESLLQLFPKLFSDRKCRLCNPVSKKNIGSSQLTISYPNYTKIPKGILDLRYKDVDLLMGDLPKDDVLLINQRLVVKSLSIRNSFSRARGLTEVLRIRVLSWLKDMDEPELTQLSIQEKEILKSKFIRGYDIRMIVHFSGQETYSYYQLLLTKSGLFSIKKLK